MMRISQNHHQSSIVFHELTKSLRCESFAIGRGPSRIKMTNHPLNSVEKNPRYLPGGNPFRYLCKDVWATLIQEKQKVGWYKHQSTHDFVLDVWMQNRSSWQFPDPIHILFTISLDANAWTGWRLGHRGTTWHLSAGQRFWECSRFSEELFI